MSQKLYAEIKEELQIAERPLCAVLSFILQNILEIRDPGTQRMSGICNYNLCRFSYEVYIGLFSAIYKE